MEPLKGIDSRCLYMESGKYHLNVNDRRTARFSTYHMLNHLGLKGKYDDEAIARVILTDPAIKTTTKTYSYEDKAHPEQSIRFAVMKKDEFTALCRRISHGKSDR